MTVKELKEVLQNLDDDMEIMLQTDSEGNGYYTVEGADPDNVYDEENGTVYSLNWTAKDACLEEEDWEELKNGPRVLIIYP